jgi:hypothetical protein
MGGAETSLPIKSRDGFGDFWLKTILEKEYSVTNSLF